MFQPNWNKNNLFYFIFFKYYVWKICFILLSMLQKKLLTNHKVSYWWKDEQWKQSHRNQVTKYFRYEIRGYAIIATCYLMSRIFVKKKEQLITIIVESNCSEGFSEFSYTWVSTILLRTDCTVNAYKKKIFKDVKFKR